VFFFVVSFHFYFYFWSPNHTKTCRFVLLGITQRGGYAISISNDQLQKRHVTLRIVIKNSPPTAIIDFMLLYDTYTTSDIGFELPVVDLVGIDRSKDQLRWLIVNVMLLFATYDTFNLGFGLPIFDLVDIEVSNTHSESLNDGPIRPGSVGGVPTLNASISANVTPPRGGREAPDSL
jgi:hypothetical protein